MTASRVDRAFARFRKGGDPRALARVFDATAGELYRLGCHLVGDAHAAEDLVQATFLVAIEDAASFEPGSAVLPWLCGILAHRARDHRRERQRRQRLVPTAIGEVADPALDASARELGEAVGHAVRALPEPYRQVLLLHLEHGLGGKEIAEAQGRPEATVRSQIHRGLDLLRKALPAGVAAMARAAAPPVHLRAVRAAVLARAGATAADLAALGAFTGVLAMKKVVLGGLVFALLLICAWPLLPEREPQVPPGAAVAASSAKAMVADQAPRPQPTGDDARREVAAEATSTAVGLEVAVVWQDDGKPVVDVAVRCTPDRPDGALWSRTERSDAMGIARFAAMAPGKTVIRADRGGKCDVEVSATGLQRVVLTLARGCDVRGRVVDLDQRPIAAAEVWLSIDTDTDDGELVARTAADGTFRIEGVTAERVITAAAEGHACTYPVVVTEKNAADLVLTLRPAPGSLLVHVLDPAGSPVANARIKVGWFGGGDKRFVGQVIGANVWPCRFFRTGADGRVAVAGLPPYRWPVLVRAPGLAPWNEDVLVSERSATALTVRLQVGGSVTGRVTTADGKAIAGAYVNGRSLAPLPPLDARISFAPRGPSGGYSVAPVRTDADGHFAIAHIAPGKVALTAWQRQDTWAETEVEVDIADRQQLVWNQVLVPQGFHGVVVDSLGKPLAGWRVSDAGRVFNVTTDAEGRFRREGLRDQLHVLTARAGPPAVGAAFLVGEFRPGPEAIRIVVPPEYVPTASLLGRVRSADGGRLAGLIIQVTLVGDDPGYWQLQSEDGSFRAGPLSEGRYRVDVHAKGLRHLQLGEWDVARGAVVDLGVLQLPAMPPPGRLAVTVIGPDGRRMPQVWLRMQRVGQPQNSGYATTKDGAGEATLAPGRYLLSTVTSADDDVPMVSREVEILAGVRNEAVFHIPVCVRFRLRVPGRERLANLQVTWRDASGAVVWEGEEHLGLRAPVESRERSIAAGRYQITVQDREGRTATGTADIHAADPPVVVDLPLPRSQ